MLLHPAPMKNKPQSGGETAAGPQSVELSEKYGARWEIEVQEWTDERLSLFVILKFG